MKRYYLFFAALGVVGAVIAAMSIALGNGLARDRNVSEDLRSISSSIDDYARNHQTLPRSLTQIPGSQPHVVRTLSEYDYHTTGVISYQLCATFIKTRTAPQDNTSSAVQSDPTYHASGRNCYTYKVDYLPNLPVQNTTIH